MSTNPVVGQSGAPSVGAGEQIRFLPGEDPDELVERAKAMWSPIRTFCMFSGGNDSSVVAHRCRKHYDELFFMDTGTAAPGVVAHVQRFAAWIDKPLRIVPAGDAYRRMVLGGTIHKRGRRAGEVERGHGFPGAGMHGKAYTRLKERQTDTLLRQVKHGQSRTAKVLFISGVRRDESKRREKRMPLTGRRAAKYVNPLIDWTNGQMRNYRIEHGLPESDVAALLHRSGECNCGAFAQAGEERAMLKSLWPEWFDATIGALEREAEAAGIRWCRWGGYDLDGIRTTEVSDEKTGIACTDCPTALDLGLAA